MIADGLLSGDGPVFSASLRSDEGSERDSTPTPTAQRRGQPNGVEQARQHSGDSPSMLRPRRHSSSSESSSSPPPSTESSPRSLSGSPQAVQRAAAHGFRRSPAGEKRRARSRLGPGLADELNTALTEAANGSPLLMSPDRTGGKHPVAAAAEAGKTADAWLERRPSSEAERSSTPTSLRRGA